MNETNQADAPGATLSEGARTIISLVLFVHLFALVVVVCSHRPSSDLVRRLRGVPFLATYLRALHMDSGYDYSLHLGRLEDRGHFVEVHERVNKEETGRTVAFPPRRIRPYVRRHRYERLVSESQYRVYIAQRNEESPYMEQIDDVLLPKAIGESLMKQHGFEEAQFDLWGRNQQWIGDLSSGEPQREDPNHPDRFQRIKSFFLVPTGDGSFEMVGNENQARRQAPPPE